MRENDGEPETPPGERRTRANESRRGAMTVMPDNIEQREKRDTDIVLFPCSCSEGCKLGIGIEISMAKIILLSGYSVVSYLCKDRVSEDWLLVATFPSYSLYNGFDFSIPPRRMDSWRVRGG